MTSQSKHLAAAIVAAMLGASAWASPGAHGPNGEHLDRPAATSPAGSAPRLETFSETFELVAQLSGGELSVMIDRYETNEPVLNGKLEVEYKGIKAPATFHADMGDYAIDDEKLVKALAAPGRHALLFTFIAGEESDLLEGTLEVSAPTEDHHDHPSRWPWIAAGAAALGVAGAVLARQRRRKTV